MSFKQRSKGLAALLEWTLLAGIGSQAAAMSWGDRLANHWWVGENPQLNQEFPFPNEQELITEQVVEMSQAISRHAASARNRRGFHAKGHACFQGQMQIHELANPELQVGVFAAPGSKSIISRFSNGSGKLQNDGLDDPRGLAIKILDVPGDRVLRTRVLPDSHDFLAVNSPVFPTRNIDEFLKFHRAQLHGGMARFLLTHPQTAMILSSHIDKDIGTMLNLTYSSGAAFKHGDRTVKFRFEPCQAFGAVKPEEPGAHYLRDDLVRRMGTSESCFYFQVQLQEDPFDHPIEDPSIEWDSPFTTVATMRFPIQEPMDSARCESLQFSPFQVLPKHRPLGNVNRVRLRVYSASQRLRG